jgi:hypothetical protein
MAVEVDESDFSRPFAAILGDTSELKILERLLAMPGFTFNLTELAKEGIVSRPIAQKIIEKFLRWQIVAIVEEHGQRRTYRLSKDSAHVRSLYDFTFATNDMVFGLSQQMNESVSVSGSSSARPNFRILKFGDEPVQETETWESSSSEGLSIRVDRAIPAGG